MKLDNFTYGKTPAAIYLVALLNKKNDYKTEMSLLSKNISKYNQIVNFLESGIEKSMVTTEVILSMLENLKKEIKLLNLSLKDEVIENLVKNMMIGSTKSLQRRVQILQDIKIQQKNLENKFQKNQLKKTIFNHNSGIVLAEIVESKLIFKNINLKDIKDKKQEKLENTTLNGKYSKYLK